jgi:hypothetical protein
MLSNEFIDQLVSIASKLDNIFLPDDVDIKNKIETLNNIISTLKTDHRNLSEPEITALLTKFKQSISDVEIATNHKLSVLDFVQNISPK